MIKGLKLERTKNAGKSMALEFLKNVYSVVVPFILRTAMIYCLGIEYTGLGGLFVSILNVLNLAELGAGAAMVFSMYKPIAEDDTDKICALMRLYKIYYRVIGGVILTAGLIITPFIGHLISGEYPSDINIYILFLMNLANTVLTYWLFAYKTSLFQAHQTMYVTSKVEIELSVVFSLLQLLSLLFFANYYIYLALNLIRQVFINIYISYKAGKMYPAYKPVGKIPSEEEKVIRSRIKDLFTSRVGGTITNSADNIVISAFLGLTLLAQYQNYFYIFSSVLALAGVVFNATRAGIGNSLICDSREKNLNDLSHFTFIIIWVETFCVSCLLGLYQPFIMLWTGASNMLPFYVVICLSIRFIVRYFNYLLLTYKDAAGAWHQDRFRPLIAGVANLVMNLAMVHFWGLLGILIASIISETFIEIPWLLRNLFSTVFQCSARKYIFLTVKYFLITGTVILLSAIFTNLLPVNGIGFFILRGMIAVAVPVLALIMLYRKSPEMEFCVDLLKRMLNKK